MNTAAQIPSAKVASPWDDVAAIYRRICLLRCRGHSADAARLADHELSRALHKVTPAGGETPAFATYRDGLYQLEEDRVHHALAVAELLAPLLLERLGAMTAPPAMAASRRPFPDRAQAPAAVMPLDIADMIDGVLEQQRTANRRRP